VYVRLSCHKSQDNTRHAAFIFMHYIHNHTHTHTHTQTNTCTHKHTHTHTSAPGHTRAHQTTLRSTPYTIFRFHFFFFRLRRLFGRLRHLRCSSRHLNAALCQITPAPLSHSSVAALPSAQHPPLLRCSTRPSPRTLTKAHTSRRSNLVWKRRRRRKQPRSGALCSVPSSFSS
jgi:hypothetical protein